MMYVKRRLPECPRIDVGCPKIGVSEVSRSHGRNNWNAPAV